VTATPVVEGAVFAVPFPYVYRPVGDSGEGLSDWKPGTRFADETPDGYPDAIADGLGVMELAVVAVFTPGRYTTRVFYTRCFVDPGGVRFGKPILRVIAVSAFRRMTKGYRYPYRVEPPR